MSEELKRIRNQTANAQSITHHGRQVVLDSYEEALVVPEIAQKFIETCPGLVAEVMDDIGGEFVDQQQDSGFIWVANMTGNPDASDMVDSKAVRDKRWVTIQIPNPKRQARPITERALGGMQEYKGKGGALEALNLFPTIYIVPPYKRRRLETATAQWMLSRDAKCEKGWTGKLIKSRAPSQFEPDMTWPLDEMRQYLRLMDPNAQLGETEAQIQRRFAKRGAKKEALIESATSAHKELTLKRLHFRLADPKFRTPPTRREFEEFYSGWKEEVEEAKAAARPKRPVGRPKKQQPEA
jgi:hypothetical protein